MDAFESGKTVVGGREREIDGIEWTPHATFRGVSMKHLVTGSATGGRLSCHLVKIDPGCEIGEHIHQGKLELHEVEGGSGECAIGEERVDYRPGTVALIPDEIKHRVTAGDAGLLILAKFSPALI